MSKSTRPTLRARQRFGKYVIERRLAEGGFATVYQARDTIEGIRVALKIPHGHLMDQETLDLFRREARLVASLEHPHILPIKSADYIENRFVIVTILGQKTLADRLAKRLSLHTALDFAEQMIDAVAYAHERRIVHCDIKPDNFLLFPDNHLRLADFGIAEVVRHTMQGSGAGTLGYVAPEQAMGKTSQKSDVFSLGVTIYEMFSGQLPSWPYDWPPAGFHRVKGRLHPDFIAILQKAMQVAPQKRYPDAGAMLAAFEKVKPRALIVHTNGSLKTGRRKAKSDWRTLQKRQFLRLYRSVLDLQFSCRHCAGPVSEPMRTCPWCGKGREKQEETTKFPQCCPRCHRGMKLDWVYCPWCYGPGFEPATNREYSDKRYVGRCSNKKCPRKQLMPFMRYCPWCQTKVKKPWLIPDPKDRCTGCGWSVVSEFWDYCPWCSKPVIPKQRQ